MQPSWFCFFGVFDDQGVHSSLSLTTRVRLPITTLPGVTSFAIVATRGDDGAVADRDPLRITARIPILATSLLHRLWHYAVVADRRVQLSAAAAQ